MARHHSPGCTSGTHTGLLAAARTQGTGAPAGSLFVCFPGVPAFLIAFFLCDLYAYKQLDNKLIALHLRLQIC